MKGKKNMPFHLCIMFVQICQKLLSNMKHKKTYARSLSPTLYVCTAIHSTHKKKLSFLLFSHIFDTFFEDCLYLAMGGRREFEGWELFFQFIRKQQCHIVYLYLHQGRIQKFFRGGFEIFLYGRKNLGRGFRTFFQKTLANWRNFSKRGGGGLTPKKPPWIRPWSTYKISWNSKLFFLFQSNRKCVCIHFFLKKEALRIW